MNFAQNRLIVLYLFSFSPLSYNSESTEEKTKKDVVEVEQIVPIEKIT